MKPVTISPAKPAASAAPKLELVGFRAGTLRLKPGDKLPDELVVVPWGRTETRRGPVVCDETTLAVFEARQAAMRRDHVMGDFNHESMPGRVPPGVLVKKACKGMARVERGRGIIVDLSAAVEGYWTREGQELVGGGHFPDMSPGIERDENGVVYGLHSFAFCEHGEMAVPELELFSAEESAPNQPTKPNTKMDYQKLLCTLLGIPGDSTDEQISAAMAAQESKPVTGMSARVQGAALLRTDDGVLKKLEAFEATVMEKLEGFAAKERKRDVAALVENAKAAGKEIKMPMTILEGMGAEAVGAYLDSLTPGVVPVSGAEQGNANPKDSKGAAGEAEGFSAEELEEAKAAGLDPEKLKANFAKIQAGEL